MQHTHIALACKSLLAYLHLLEMLQAANKQTDMRNINFFGCSKDIELDLKLLNRWFELTFSADLCIFDNFFYQDYVTLY